MLFISVPNLHSDFICSTRPHNFTKLFLKEHFRLTALFFYFPFVAVIVDHINLNGQWLCCSTTDAPWLR